MPDRTLIIAFRTNGGVGNVIICANFIKCFRETFKNIKIVVFGHPINDVTEAIFKGQDFIDEYYNYCDLRESDFDYYDLIIDLRSFPEILKADFDKIHGINPKLFNLVKKWEDFHNDNRYVRYFTLQPYLNSQIYLYGILNNKTCVNIADIDNLLKLGKSFNLDLKIFKDEKKILKDLGLTRHKFITLQRGVNPFSGVVEAPKMWPLSNYDELVILLKKRYPKIKIVQLGESSDRCARIKGIDVNLVGKTTWEDIKILLKNALYHIDGECGMVHLREALNGGPSVVLFGPTPKEFFGYSDNINISTSACSHWCAALTSNWQKKCVLGTAKCMSSIKPEFVIKCIDDYENSKAVKLVSVYEKLVNDTRICLDKIWTKNWLCKQILYEYEIVSVNISSLKIYKFVDGHFIVVNLSESPAVKFLEGYKKQYIEYCNYKNKFNPEDIHSEKRFSKLISEYKNNSTISIVVNEDNVILDGQHRASILYHQNPEQKINIVKIYGDF